MTPGTRLSRLAAAFSKRQYWGTLLLSMNVFLLMTIYYVLKTVRESLILTQGGAEVKSYSAFAQAIALLFIMPVYSALASRVKRVHLIGWIMGLFATNLFAFAALDRAHVRIGVVFFVWLGIFSVTVVTQMWAFANDLYSEEQGKRILPILGLAAALGALAGAQLATRVYSLLSIGQIMMMAAVLLLACTAITAAIDSFERSHSQHQAEVAARPVGGEGAFRMVLTNRYFLLIAVLIVLVNMANSTGEFMLSKLAIRHADEFVAAHGSPAAMKRQLIGAFYGSYYAWGGFVGLILQAVFVPAVLRRLGAGRALLVGPGISAVGYAMVAIAPGLGVAEVAKIAENSMDYSLGRTALNALFLRTSRAAKYKVKTVLDTFFYRSGDLLQGLLVLGGTSLALDVRQYAILNVAFAIASAAVVFAIEREYRRSSEPKPAPVFQVRSHRRVPTLVMQPSQGC